MLTVRLQILDVLDKRDIWMDVLSIVNARRGVTRENVYGYLAQLEECGLVMRRRNITPPYAKNIYRITNAGRAHLADRSAKTRGERRHCGAQ